MKKQFAGSGFGPMGFVILFLCLALFFAVTGSYSFSLILILSACSFFLFFLFSFRVYTVTSDGFYISNYLGMNFGEILFDDMVKLYTLRGFEGSFYRGGGGYNTVILRIQLKNREIFQLDMSEVWSDDELLEALQEELGEHMVDLQHKQTMWP